MKRFAPILVVVGLLACAGSASALSYRPAGITAADTPLEAATALVEQRPDLVGGAPVSRIDIASEVTGAGNTTVVRFDQSVRGVPILGGDVVVAVDDANRVVAADGGTLTGSLPSLTPTIAPGEAQRIARAGAGGTTPDVPALAIFDPSLTGTPGPARASLVWSVDVVGTDGARSTVYVDARTGAVRATQELREGVKNRVVCDAANSNGALPCSSQSSFARVEGGGATAVSDVNDAYDFAGITYDYYWNILGRDGIDGQGSAIYSTVRSCGGGACPYANAFWDAGAQQMIYGLGYAGADDVVAHELTHGVTDSTSHLFYWYQSGAINEALSDIVGEFVDQLNPASAKLPNVAADKWLLGEDLAVGTCSVRGYAPIRDMQNPLNCNDPDKVSSGRFWTNAGDSGGVHTNSGVVNKTAYLIADGDTFNGHTVRGLGLTKSAHLWYQTELLLRSGSSFADLAAMLQQACTSLVGSEGFVADDCTQVGEATAATELTATPASSTTPAAVCSTGQVETTFADPFEAGADGRWTKDNAVSTSPGGDWYYSTEANGFSFDAAYAVSGSANVWGNDPPGISDTRFAMTNPVVIPTGAFLRFAHADGFETIGGGTTKIAGGVLEYSTDGATWTDAGSLMTVNGYTGTVSSGHSNPLQGRSAFVGYSKGYTATRLDLSSLAGQSVRFRFRIGTGSGGSAEGDYGWFIDDVSIYTCPSSAVERTTTVSVTAADAIGAGTVISSPVGVRCAVGSAGSCTFSSTAASIVSLNAVPSFGSAFVGWSGACAGSTPVCTVTTTQARAVSAAFRRSIFALAVSRSGTGDGTVSSVPSGITCGATCTANIAAGTVVTLTATPAAGSSFAGWSGACTGTGTCTVTVAADTAVSAAFTAAAAPTAQSASASTSTPATPTAKTPPASGLWTTNTATDMVRAVFAYRRGTTYAIKAVRGSTTRRGTCTRVNATIRCTVKAPTGTWRVTVTPKVDGRAGKAIVRTVKT